MGAQKRMELLHSPSVCTGLLTFGVASGVAVAVALALSPTDGAKTSSRVPSEYRGLANAANHCFVNSLLQALAGSPSFLRWLSALGECGGPLSTALQRTLLSLNEAVEGGDVASAVDVVREVERLGWVLGGDEQDSFELLNVLLSAWEEQLNSPQRGLGANLASAAVASEVSAVDGSCRQELSLLRLRLLRCSVSQERARRLPCQAWLGTKLQCRTCNRRRMRQDSCLALSLPLPPLGLEPSLRLCLRNFLNSELVRGIRCEACDANTDHVKRQGFTKLPTVLLLRLERLTPGGLKREDVVDIPPVLDLSDFLLFKGPTAAPRPGASYALCALVQHLGGSGSGHFVAFRPGPQGNWLRFSDAQVTRLSFHSLIATIPAYMLVYERLAPQ